MSKVEDAKALYALKIREKEMFYHYRPEEEDYNTTRKKNKFDVCLSCSINHHSFNKMLIENCGIVRCGKTWYIDDDNRRKEIWTRKIHDLTVKEALGFMDQYLMTCRHTNGPFKNDFEMFSNHLDKKFERVVVRHFAFRGPHPFDAFTIFIHTRNEGTTKRVYIGADTKADVVPIKNTTISVYDSSRMSKGFHFDREDSALEMDHFKVTKEWRRVCGDFFMKHLRALSQSEDITTIEILAFTIATYAHIIEWNDYFEDDLDVFLLDLGLHKFHDIVMIIDEHSFQALIRVFMKVFGVFIERHLTSNDATPDDVDEKRLIMIASVLCKRIYLASDMSVLISRLISRLTHNKRDYLLLPLLINKRLTKEFWGDMEINPIVWKMLGFLMPERYENDENQLMKFTKQRQLEVQVTILYKAVCIFALHTKLLRDIDFTYILVYNRESKAWPKSQRLEQFDEFMKLHDLLRLVNDFEWKCRILALCLGVNEYDLRMLVSKNQPLIESIYLD